jgi:hypothetical protein
MVDFLSPADMAKWNIATLTARRTRMVHQYFVSDAARPHSPDI